MHELDKNREVGIIVPTMNRSDFMIRLLNYYASLNYRYTIYIGDSSDENNSSIVKNEIKKIGDKLKIDYHQFYDGDGIECIAYLLSKVKEKYVTFIGDDDYNVPETIYACAEFLEGNPDYETAMGESVTIRVDNNGAYGKLTEIHDYPRCSIEEDTASKRLYHHLVIHFNSLIASILPTKNILKYYLDSSDIKDSAIRGEVLPCSLMVIAGKSKVLDQIGLVRQIHTTNIKNADIFDEITHQNWPESYALSKKILTGALIEKDGLTQVEAEETVKKCFWANLNTLLTLFYPQYLAIISRSRQTKTGHELNNKTKVRMKIASSFPFLKQAYRKFIRPMLTDKQQLHYEVLQPKSKYYKDFQSILRSLKKHNNYDY